jgi:DnaJ-class molecular chaperone
VKSRIAPNLLTTTIRKVFVDESCPRCHGDGAAHICFVLDCDHHTHPCKLCDGTGRAMSAL